MNETVRMAVIYAVIAVFALTTGAVDGYQALTGKRVSKRPSRRPDSEMRRQSVSQLGSWSPLACYSMCSQSSSDRLKDAVSRWCGTRALLRPWRRVSPG